MNDAPQFNPLAQLGGQLVQGAQADPLMDIMRQYVQAKREFDTACEQFQLAQEKRAKTEQALLQLSEKVAQIVAAGKNDPTMPQPTAPSQGLINPNFGAANSRY